MNDQDSAYDVKINATGVMLLVGVAQNGNNFNQLIMEIQSNMNLWGFSENQ